jgi:hypothetical protein
MLLPRNLYNTEIISVYNIVKVSKRIAAKHPYAESPEAKSGKLKHPLEHREKSGNREKKRAAYYAEKIANGILFILGRYISSHIFSPLVITKFTPQHIIP